jgi:two-component system, NarL family, response regulator NreC
MSVTVVLADDHTMVRTGLRLLLERHDMEVVAEAGDVESALRYVRGHRPDVLVLDLNMPGDPVLPAIPHVADASPGTRVVVLTMQESPGYAREAFGAGACGYVLKEAAESALVAAIEAALAGDSYVDPAVGARLAKLGSTPPGPPDGLTERELEVLRLLALGYTNAEIADQLYVSRRTVESHRAHIQQKTRLATRAELVRYAMDHELVS